MTGNDPITAEDNATQEERVDDVDEAIAIACTDAGVSQRELFDTKQQREEESGIAVHKIEFETAYGDYDYAIAVEDGRIIDADYEVDEGIHFSTLFPVFTSISIYIMKRRIL